MRVYVNSDILIRHLRGERRAATLLRRLGHAADAELWTGATAEGTGGKIVTQNVKHYPMPDVIVQKGW